jgi:hypothetical protein
MEHHAARDRNQAADTIQEHAEDGAVRERGKARGRFPGSLRHPALCWRLCALAGALHGSA